MKTKDFKRRIVRGTMMLFALVTTTQAWALSQEDGYYLIGSAQDLKDFAALVNGGNPTANGKLISANGDLNAIGTLHTQTGEVTLDGWYTLDGTRLSGQPTRKGIYVNNGKKVVIK